MSFKWTESTMFNFLKLYRKYSCLWDNRLDTYKNKEAREAALQSILKELDIADLTVFDVKTKIKTVRTMYKKEYLMVSKSKRNGLGPNALYTPKLFWYKKADEFLNSVTNRRESMTNPNLPQDVAVKVEDVEIKVEAMDDRTETFNEMDLATSSEYLCDDSHEEAMLSGTPESTNRPTITIHSPRTVKRKMVQDLSGAIGVEKLDNCCNKHDCENEFDIFGKHIAVQLKQMPLFDALICQKQIQTVLRQKRLEIIMRQSQNQTTVTSTLTSGNTGDSEYFNHSPT